MYETILATAARLSDDALHSHLKALANRECSSTVELVGHLAELDGRKAHLGEGPGSLYTYCRDGRNLCCFQGNRAVPERRCRGPVGGRQFERKGARGLRHRIGLNGGGERRS